MKKLLILSLSLISFFGYSQTLIDPTLTPTTARINAAISDAVAASGTDTYTGTKAGLTNVTDRAYSVKFPNTNTTSATFNLNGAGAVTIRKYESGSLVNLVAGDITGGQTYRLRYNGTYLVIEGGSGGGGSSTFEDLTDGPGSYSGKGGNYMRVNTGENGLEYRTPTEVISDLPNAVADGTNKGVSTFTANDFDASSGNISIDYTNGQAASGATKGFLTSADWTTFNGKQSALTLGTGVQTWLATPSWTNFNSAITGTAPFWPLTGTATRTGNTTIVGTGYTLTHQYASLGATKTIGYGLYLQNPTPATLGAQQWSPSWTVGGNAFLTTSSTSVDVSYSGYVIPVQGAGTAGGTFVLEPTVNGSTLTSGYLKMSATGAQLDVGTNGLQVRTSSGGVGGISLTGSAPVSGQILMTPGSFAITTASNWSSGGKGVIISAGSSVNATSGTQNAISMEGNFIPTSGSANFRALNFPNTINQTGGANGVVNFISMTPTYTSAADVIAYDYAPASGSPTSHLVWRNVSGNLLFGGSTITASTRLDIRGQGTTSSTIALRIANSSNVAALQVTDDGALALKNTIVGRAVLVAGTATVNTAVVQSGDEILLTNRITGGTVGFLSIGTVTNGTSFVINSSSALDTSTISWMIIKTAP